MKKLFLIGAFIIGVFTVQNVYSQVIAQPGCAPALQQSYAGSNLVQPNYATANFAQPGFGPGNQCEEQPVGQCYCLYVRYEPCYYTTTRCVEEQIPCTKRCCRFVPQYYQVQKCRMVPEYYTETRCRQVPEYYDVEYSRCCKKTICEPQCRFVPRYYWKYTCGDNTTTLPCKR